MYECLNCGEALDGGVVCPCCGLSIELLESIYDQRENDDPDYEPDDFGWHDEYPEFDG